MNSSLNRELSYRVAINIAPDKVTNLKEIQYKSYGNSIGDLIPGELSLAMETPLITTSSSQLCSSSFSPPCPLPPLSETPSLLFHPLPPLSSTLYISFSLFCLSFRSSFVYFICFVLVVITKLENLNGRRIMMLLPAPYKGKWRCREGFAFSYSLLRLLLLFYLFCPPIKRDFFY